MHSDKSAKQNSEQEHYPYHRRHIRHRVRLKVDLKVNESYEAWTKNMSENGVCFEIPKQLPVGREVVVWIYPYRGKEEPIQGRCRIVWREEGKKDVRHGAQFLFFSSNGLDRIRKYLSELTKASVSPSS